MKDNYCVKYCYEIDTWIYLCSINLGFDTFKEELGSSRDASLRRDTSLNGTYDEQDIMKVILFYVRFLLAK